MKNKKPKTPRRTARRNKKTRIVTPQAGVTAIIPYSEIARPEIYHGKFSLVPTVLTELQIKSIIAPTPANIIKNRPGKGGGTWDYVPGWWFKKKLNFTFGFCYDFKVLGERVDGEYITVKGEITVRHPKTGQIIAVKGDYGGAQIKFKKGEPHTPANYLDMANDFKAACTDAFKRCAVQFGFAMDVYGKNESKDEGFTVQIDPQPAPRPAGPAATSMPTQRVCVNCDAPISETEYTYSKKAFGKNLCRDCQKNAKKQ